MASYYIQYHNADKLGTYPTEDLDFKADISSLIIDNSVKYASWIYTSKKTVEGAIGEYCFLIVGKTDKIKKYYLWSFFKIEEYEIADNGGYIVYGHGYDFERPVILNEVENFNDFKNYCGNFGLGFQNIDKHIFCKTLSSLADEAYLLENSKNILFPSTQQYQDVISSSLSAKQIEILQTLYYFPDSSATAKELAKALNYESYHAANRQIGQIGKVISQYTGIVPPTYNGKNGEQPAYFLLIGQYYKDTGWEMWGELQQALKNLNLVSVETDNSSERLPTETFQLDEKELFKEGKVVQVFVNRYERNQGARQECIRHHGDKCFACGFDFGITYGDIAKGFIHVHHLTQLADINEEYDVDPINDLVPLCANCHSVIHLTMPAMTIEELKKRLKESSR
jgi:predicted HNH restriction endonuclease